MTPKEIQLIVSGANRSATAPEPPAAGRFADGTIGRLREIGRAVVELRTLVRGGVFGAALDGLTGEDDQLDRLSQRIGITAEELQILRRAMELGDSAGRGLGTAFETLTGHTLDLQSSSSAGREALQSLGLPLNHLGDLPLDDARLRSARASGKVADQATESALAPGMLGCGGPPSLPAPDVAGSDVDARPGMTRSGDPPRPDEQTQGLGELSLATPGLNAAIKGVLFDALASRVGLVSQALADLVKPGDVDEGGASPMAAPRPGGPDQVRDLPANSAGTPPPLASHSIDRSAEHVAAEVLDGLRRVVRELDHAALAAAQVAAEAWNVLLASPVCVDRFDEAPNRLHADQRMAATGEEDGPTHAAPRDPQQGIATKREMAVVEEGPGLHAQTAAREAPDANTDTMAASGQSTRTTGSSLDAITARVAALLSAALRPVGLPPAEAAANRPPDQGSAIPSAASMASPSGGRPVAPGLPDFALPMPNLPTVPGPVAGALPGIASDIAAIKANTATMAQQGIL